MKYFTLIVLSLIFMACPASDRIVEQQEMFIEDQLELDLQDKMSPKRIVTSFPTMGLKYLCTIDENKNIAVFQFDPKVKTKKEMMKFLVNEVGVQFVQETKGCQ